MKKQAAMRASALAAMAAALFVRSAVATAAPPLLEQAPSLTLSAALQVAQATLKDCRERGALIAVAVVDRAGQPLATLRDQNAGMHTPDTALRKAWTAVSFRGATTALEKATRPDGPNAAIRSLSGVAMLGGGLPIEAAGKQVGGVGVSGAPSGEMDEACAQAGVKAIADDLEFGS